MREIPVNIGGKTYRITSDDNYLDQIQNGFEPEMVRLFRAVATGSHTILDIGANIGCTALLFSELAQTVYAFEPAQTTFSFLEKNIAQSGLKNIVSQNIGLGEEPGEFELSYAPSDRSGGFVSNQVETSSGHAVERIVVKRLDDVVDDLDLAQLDFMKLDVEGFEGHVLRGASKTLAKFKPVVVLELNHWCLNAFQRTSVPDFFDFLRSVFPILYAVDNLSYMDLHNASDSYTVMYYHILNMRFPNIVAAFDEQRLQQFKAQYEPGFVLQRVTPTSQVSRSLLAQFKQMASKLIRNG